MAVAQQAEQLKINANNIRSVLTAGNYVVKKNRIKLRDLTYREDQAILRRNKEEKIEAKKSVLGSSIKKIGNAVLGGPMSLFDKIINFASLILFGTMLSTLPSLIMKVNEWVDNLKGTFNNIGDFIGMLYENGKWFVDNIGTPALDNIISAFKQVDWENLKKQSEKLTGILGKLNKTRKSITGGMSDAGDSIKKIAEDIGNAVVSGSEAIAPTFHDPDKTIIIEDGVSTGKTSVELAREKFYVDQNGNVRRHSDNKKAHWDLVLQFPSVDKDRLEKKNYTNSIGPQGSTRNIDSLGPTASIGGNDTIYIINRTKVRNAVVPIPVGATA